MTTFLPLLALVFSSFLPTVAAAHHSIADNYDSKKSIRLSGRVNKIYFAAPHIFFFIDVADSNGTREEWAVEGNSPTALSRIAFTMRTLSPGDRIMVVAFPPKTGARIEGTLPTAIADELRQRLKASRLVHGVELTMANGKTVAVGDIQ